MTRLTVIVAVVALVLGVAVGYLFWGLQARRPADEDLAARLARELDAAQARQRQAQAALGALEGRLKALEEELARERQRRARLELVVSEGRK